MSTTQPHLLHARQLWNFPTSVIVEESPAHCTAFTLPSNGVLSIGDSAITLTADALFKPECTARVATIMTANTIDLDGLVDPFYASTIPMTYVLAACFVMAWVLVLMLTITTRTSFIGSPINAPGFNTGHGIIGGANGGSASSISAGSRPWLQKVAALTVAVSLTIATADTFKVAMRQYDAGYMSALQMREEVLDSTEIRVTRVISDVFLWLAQVQTLIRLFPRHKEKVLIKWIGFALIIFDSVFSCLNSFLYRDLSRGRHFTGAIPALCYLFELAVGLLYAAWVIFYAITKRRYAFYHHKMRSICLIALLSLVAVLTPVVFFVTDVSNQDIGSWGDYVRWVGAAAASVVVWEWVERIEALERDEKKDGILGREVFDGDEMLDVDPSEDAVYGRREGNSRALFRRRGRDNDNNEGGNAPGTLESGFSHVASRFRHRQSQAPAHFPLGRAHSASEQTNTEHEFAAGRPGGNVVFTSLPQPERALHTEAAAAGLRPPHPIASPVSRTDTSSAASTVYVVQHDLPAGVPEPVRRKLERGPGYSAAAVGSPAVRIGNHYRNQSLAGVVDNADDQNLDNRRPRGERRWHAMPNPFKRKRLSPPQEIQQAISLVPQRANTPAHNFSRWDIKNQIGVLAAEAGSRVRDRNPQQRSIDDLPVMIIPVQPRHGGRQLSTVITEESPQEEQPSVEPSRSDPQSPPERIMQQDIGYFPVASAASSPNDSTTTRASSHSINLQSNEPYHSPQYSSRSSSSRTQQSSSQSTRSPQSPSHSSQPILRHNTTSPQTSRRSAASPQVSGSSNASAAQASSRNTTSPSSEQRLSPTAFTPPRADDLTPSGGDMTRTIIVPAPPRRR